MHIHYIPDMGVVNDMLSFRGALTQERLGDEWLRFYAAEVSADRRGRLSRGPC